MAAPVCSHKASILNKSRSKFSARSVAALALKDVLVHRQSLDTALARHGKQLAANDAGLAKALCYGVLRHYESLSAQLKPLLDKPLRNKDFDVQALLLVGAYQLAAMRMPDYAAIDSVVDASKMLKKPWASGLINAVLRKLQKADANSSNLQISSEHPLWLFKAIRQAWPQYSEAIFQANNHEPPLCLRVNQRRSSRADYLARLDAAGIKACAGQLADSAIYLIDKPDDITTLPGFTDGDCSVQDEAAQMAAVLLDAKPGMRILDACAAPGGKTGHILEQLDNQASVLALDIDASRLERVQQNLDRLQLTAQLTAADILSTGQWWDGQPFDRILCDVPCSATGVIRRHPDIKYLRQPDDIAKLAQLQLQILQTLWPLLKPGGILLYATCSIMPEENNDVLAQFCTQQHDCREVTAIPPAAVARPATEHGWQLLPQLGGHDGFYYARLQKRDADQ